MKKMSLVLLAGLFLMATPMVKAELKGGSIDYKKEKALVVHQTKKKQVAFAISGREIIINKGAAYRQRRGSLYVISPYTVSKERTAYRDPMGVLIRAPQGSKDKILLTNKQGQIVGGVGLDQSEVHNLAMRNRFTDALDAVDDLFDFVESDLPYAQISTLGKLPLMSEDDNGGFGPIGSKVSEDDNGGFGPIGSKVSEDDNGGFGPIGFIAEDDNGGFGPIGSKISEDDNGGFGPIGTKSEDDNGGFGPIGMVLRLPAGVNATCDGSVIFWLDF